MAVESPELLAVMRRKAVLLSKLNAAVKANGLAFYRPHEKQDAFHRSTKRRRMFRAGNRSGKSTCGCTEDVAWLLGERAWYKKGDPARTSGIPQHPVRLLTITTDWDKVDEIFTTQRGDPPGKVWRYLPTDAIKERGLRRNHSGAIDTIELRNGSLWRFDTVKSWMANPAGSESSDWDAIHVDEPCPEGMFKAAARGLVDRGGSAWFTLTPLTEFWINDYFFPQDTGGAPRDDVFAVQGSMYDNPHLPIDAIKEFEASLTEEERQCRISGIPLHLSGLIYKDFRWDRHVLKEVPKGWESWVQPPLNWPVYYFVDPHPQTPHAVLFCTVSPQGSRVYFNDIFKHCGIGELCSDIHGVLGPRRVVDSRIDPLAFIFDPITESTMAEEFAKYGCYVEKATKALAQGIIRVQAELRRNPGHIFFTPACRRTLWEIQRYAWDEEENKPIDKDDHMMENLYRCELSEPKWVDFNERQVPVSEQEIVEPELELESLDYAE